MKLKRKLATGLAATTLAVGTLLGTASGASANGVSYVWDDYSNSAPIYQVPTTQVAPERWAPNGTKFQMDCWMDNDNRRWFYGQMFDNGEWAYVEANWVGDQTTVPAC